MALNWAHRLDNEWGCKVAQLWMYFLALAVVYLLLLAVSNPAFAYFEKRANRGYATPA